MLHKLRYHREDGIYRGHRRQVLRFSCTKMWGASLGRALRKVFVFALVSVHPAHLAMHGIR